ncbi:MAG: hypothetical protein MK538_09440 [Planctomycetes bacterium]|nr:hypothetical protein [Planctomycetota bacterium]
MRHAWTLAVVVVGVSLMTASANDQVLVTLADAPWRARLRGALDDLQQGRHDRGLQTLQEALLDSRGVVFEVRNPEVLDDPFGVEVGDGFLVPKKSRRGPPQPRSPTPLRGSASSRQAARRFLALSTVADRILAKLPDDVRAKYRARFDGEARALLDEYRETYVSRALQLAVRRYFHSSFGGEIADLLGDHYREEGRYREALFWWSRGREAHQVSPQRLSSIEHKVAAVSELLGDPKAFDDAAETEDPKGEADATQGAEVEIEASQNRTVGDYRDVLRRYHARTLARRGVGQDGSLLTDPTGAGDPSAAESSRSRRAPSLWGGEFFTGKLPRLPLGPLELSWENPFVQGAYPRLGTYHFVPLLSGSSLYVPSPDAIRRYDARPAHGSISEEYKVMSGLFGRPERQADYQFTLTLWQKRLEPRAFLSGLPNEFIVTSYVADNVRPDAYLGYEINVELPVRGLMAFDASQPARPLWKVFETPELDLLSVQGRTPRRSRFHKHKEAGQSAGEKGLSYHSPVIMKEGLVVAGAWVQRGYINSVLRAHDARDGSLVWETLLCSFQLEQTMFGELAREPFPGAIAERNGVIYYSTQLGAVFAVELATGRILWGTTYDTIPVKRAFGRHAPLRDILWSPNSPLLVGDTVIVTPRDSHVLYGIDTGYGASSPHLGGRVVWRYSNRTGDLRDLLGYHDGYLYFMGGNRHSGIVRVRVGSRPQPRPRSPAKGGPTNLRRHLQRTPPRLGLGRHLGPGLLTADGIVVLDGSKIKLISLDLQGVEDLVELPDANQLSAFGQFRTTEDMLILASQERIWAFVSSRRLLRTPLDVR